VDKALQNVSKLQTHKFAFVYCSDGTWTYAIVADCPVEKGTGPDVSIRLVLDSDGSTKTLPRDHWGRYIAW
jgi:hypothetical protein